MNAMPSVRIAAAVVAVAAIFGMGQAWGASPEFRRWLQDLRAEALSAGVSAATLDRALAAVEPVGRVIELDRQQPEFTQTFWNYLNKRVTSERIERGRKELAKNRTLLDLVARRYGVQPRFLVAFWALESNFGDNTGGFEAVSALATLAFDTRRNLFFRTQLLALLETIDRGDIRAGANSSWAGAMGQPQFIPTTYKAYAVDFDGDGRRDLWNSLADVFGSSANYLKAAGWQANQTWGREVLLPPGFDYALSEMDVRKPVSEWQRLGVRDARGRPLPNPDVEASIILPGGAYGGPALMVYQNFRTIMAWNRSILYAVAVGHLADRLAGEGPFVTPPPASESPLSRSQVKEMQYLLVSRGFDAGDADGIVGPQTRRAIRAFQQYARLPADGFPTPNLLQNLRATASN